MIMLFEGEFATQDTLRFIEEKGGIGLWAWDLRTDEMLWSPGVYALADLEIGRTKPSYDIFISLIHPDDRLSQSEVERLIGAGLPLLRNFRLITRNGRVRWVSNDSEVLFDPAGKPTRVIGALFDVTRQHDAILATRAAEERYRALVEASGLVAWTSRPDGTGGDPEWLRFSAQTPEDAMQIGWLGAVVPEERNAVEAGWREAVVGRRAYERECRLVLGEGEPHWFCLRAAPVLSGHNGIREWVWTAEDIQERKLNPLLHSAANGPRQLTGAQIRAARGLLNWSVRDLSEASGVSPSVIRRLEEFNGAPGTREERMGDIQAAFERSGVEFLFPTLGKPGVRLH
jgi:PAS domain-containing protein